MKLEIIAELAQGFEGRPEQARLLVKAAATAGADAAKLQLVYADELATPDYKHYALFRTLEMADEVWAGLAASATEWGIALQLDIFGSRSLHLAERIGVGAIKLHPTDIANVGLLEEVARSRVSKILLGAGGAHSAELTRALDLLKGKQVIVLLGFQGYPTPTASNQIARVRALVEKLKQSHPHAVLGFADHALPDSPLRYALAATAVGAGVRVLEKHLTLGQVMKLEDHESALNPDDFAEFVRVLSGCDEAIGVAGEAEDFGMSGAEHAYRKMIRRHVVANRNLEAGESVLPNDVVLKRTSAEQAVTEITSIYKKKMKQQILKNMPIKSICFD